LLKANYIVRKGGNDEHTHTRRTRTQQYLIEALIELAQTKSVHLITVKELCAQAQVNRTTFYKRYPSFPEFLSQITQDFIDNMTSYVSDNENPYRQMLFGDNPYPYFLHCVEFMDAQTAFLRMMLGSNGLIEFSVRVKKVWISQIYEALIEGSPQINEGVNSACLASFIGTGMWGMLDYNLQSDMMYSTHFMAKQLMMFTSHTLLRR